MMSQAFPAAARRIPENFIRGELDIGEANRNRGAGRYFHIRRSRVDELPGAPPPHQPATRRNLLGNRLVLVAPAGSDVTVEIKPGFDLAALLKGGRLAMADTD